MTRHAQENSENVSEITDIPIDIVLVSGRRPELLRRTLISFVHEAFQHFRIANVIANIDPFAGDNADHLECKRIILDVFPQASIFEPDVASLGRAVIRIWSNSSAPYLLHLEDDWEALKPITPARAFPLFQGNVRAVSFRNEFEIGVTKQYRTRVDEYKILGHTIVRRVRPFFCTSPGLWSGSFARECAALMKPHLDPEKQFILKHNRALRKHVSSFSTRVLAAPDGSALIRDIGREWREDRGIVKGLKRGRSYWTRVQRERIG